MSVVARPLPKGFLTAADLCWNTLGLVRVYDAVSDFPGGIPMFLVSASNSLWHE